VVHQDEVAAWVASMLIKLLGSGEPSKCENSRQPQAHESGETTNYLYPIFYSDDSSIATEFSPFSSIRE
jgi:hypothetical protein